MSIFLNKLKKMYNKYFNLGINNDEDIENEENDEDIENEENEENKRKFNIVMNQIKNEVKKVDSELIEVEYKLNNIKYKLD